MAKYMISLLERKEVQNKDAKLQKQATEILKWMDAEYGVDTPVDQKDLIAKFDEHQEDNKILSATPRQPISRIFAFYRKRLETEGYIRVDKEASAKSDEAEVDSDNPNPKKPAAKRSRRKDAPVEEDGGMAGAGDGVL